jgi:hypothetical protein
MMQILNGCGWREILHGCLSQSVTLTQPAMEYFYTKLVDTDIPSWWIPGSG